jgi:hypothetical protein
MNQELLKTLLHTLFPDLHNRLKDRTFIIEMSEDNIISLHESMLHGITVIPLNANRNVNLDEPLVYNIASLHNKLIIKHSKENKFLIYEKLS